MLCENTPCLNEAEYTVSYYNPQMDEKFDWVVCSIKCEKELEAKVKK